jgi:hypothetical protein
MLIDENEEESEKSGRKKRQMEESGGPNDFLASIEILIIERV